MNKKWLMISGFFLGLCCLIGCIILWGAYQTNSDQDLTPESVVDMFADAGYEVSELQAVSEYTGPLSDKRVIRGGEFSIKLTSATVVTACVAFYSNGLDAAYVTRESNALNKRMNGGFSYAYRRGTVVLSIDTFDSNIAQELGEVFLRR